MIESVLKKDKLKRGGKKILGKLNGHDPLYDDIYINLSENEKIKTRKKLKTLRDRRRQGFKKKKRKRRNRRKRESPNP